MTVIDEIKTLDHAVRTTWPGASAHVWAGGVDDPWPMYKITFRNGVVFYGGVKAAVIADANRYAQGVKNLTGEWP